MSAEEVLKQLASSQTKGLTDKEVSFRLEKFGRNEIEEKKKISAMKIFVRQFTSFIVLILVAAMLISFFIADPLDPLILGIPLDSFVIGVIIILNGIFGFIQEYRAEKAIESLKKLTALKAKVIREGEEREIDSKDLVPGDIIILETGNKVPADARLLELAALEINESAITGESVSSQKNLNAVDEKALINDQKNMVFTGTIIIKGHAKAIVTGTGKNSEIGKIAQMVSETEEKLTPLQEKLKRFGHWLGFITLGICAVVFFIGVFREYLVTSAVNIPFMKEMFLAAVALAVAAIPEGLPAIVTISLALGVRRMSKRNALIRELPAVETLGCTNVICSDKTGTLTKNEMTVKRLYVNNEVLFVKGEGYAPKGIFARTDNSTEDLTDDSILKDTKNIELLMQIGALCNDSNLSYHAKWEIFGDPTEGALIVSAEKAGVHKSVLEEKYPRIDEIPFDSNRKCMTTIHNINDKIVAYVKGAPDMVLEKCSYVNINGEVIELSDEQKNKILQENTDLANNAFRVLGFAYKELKPKYQATVKEIENNLVFVGLQAMIDPPREEVKDSIQKCRDAGIRTIMITGDHKLTAIAIAKQLGLYKEGDLALSGEELDEMSEEELNKAIDKIVICARVSPEHKVKVLEALRAKEYVVAMTGDGVNDAPALKKSDIGVAMGLTGTDVAKEASDMVLTDDNFTSIVNAVEEGRGIYSNIKQFIQYTLSSNLGEILVIFFAILIGWPLPLIAIQILWVNLLTDGLPGLALGMDPFSNELMKHPPRNKKENIITRDVVQNILIVGVVMAIGTLSLFFLYDGTSGDMKAKTVAFTALILFQLFNVLTYRAKHFHISVKNSKFLIGSVIISILLQLAIVYTPLSIAFKTVPLSLIDWGVILGVTCTLYIILEIRKIILHNLGSRYI